jgi:hypothetical protein
MKRVRLLVDMDPELRRRVKVAAARKDQSVKEWIEDMIERELDRTWMESDLSRLGEFEPYEWEEGELDEGKPVSGPSVAPASTHAFPKERRAFNPPPSVCSTRCGPLTPAACAATAGA